MVNPTPERVWPASSYDGEAKIDRPTASLRGMTPAFVTTKWTTRQYHQMIEAGILDDCRVELLNGEIVEMPPEREPHAHLSCSAADYIRELLRGTALIREGKPITLPHHSEPEPDIAIVQDLGDRYLEHHPYPEHIFWLIEYANTSLAKDLEIKRQLYAQAQIPEYWVVNLKRMELILFRHPGDEDYREKRTLIEGEIQPLAFATVTIAVDRLIRRQ